MQKDVSLECLFFLLKEEISGKWELHHPSWCGCNPSSQGFITMNNIGKSLISLYTNRTRWFLFVLNSHLSFLKKSFLFFLKNFLPPLPPFPASLRTSTFTWRKVTLVGCLVLRKWTPAPSVNYVGLKNTHGLGRRKLWLPLVVHTFLLGNNQKLCYIQMCWSSLMRILSLITRCKCTLESRALEK